MGNTLHDASQGADDDCNMACAGNRAELCGGGNRIQVYQDATWINPTADDLAAFLQQYHDILAQSKLAIDKYTQDIKNLQAALTRNPPVRKFKRQSQTEIIELQNMVVQDSVALRTAQQIMGKYCAKSLL